MISPRFAVMILASLLAFYAVLRFTLRARLQLWLYYGVPACLTWLLPPVAFRLSAREFAQYLGLAILMAPTVHVLFSLILGWKEYMPFIPVRSLGELLGA